MPKTIHEPRPARRQRPGPAVVLDRQGLLDRVGGDRELLRELVGIFLDESAGWLAAIEASVYTQDARGLKLHAHLLAGTAASLGAQVLSDAARDLELMGQTSVLSGAVEAYRRLLAAAAELEPCLLEMTRVPA